MKRMSLTICLVFIASIYGAPSYADVYKWVDQDGQIHFSDKKPQGNTNAQKIKVKGIKNISGTNANSAAPKDQYASEDELKAKAEKLKNTSGQPDYTEQCAKIEENLRKITENSRIRINENGNIRFLTPEEIEARRANYQEQLDTYCTPQAS